MIDFHIHVGPGGMLPAEALRCAALRGCRAAGLILRDDGGGLDRVGRLAEDVRRLGLYADVEAFAGVELVHVPPALLPDAVADARKAGAHLVLVHGETLGDCVAEGSNFAAIEAGADILAHPGLLDDGAAARAAEKGVALELTACPRHGLSNAHVAAMAARFGCPLVPGGDARTPDELARQLPWKAVCLGAGMTAEAMDKFYNDARNMVKRLMQA